MSAHMEFWLEVRRAIARWTGVMIASVICGLLLGLFRRQGIAYKTALEMALPVGFLLALLFWVLLSRRFSAVVAAEHTTALTIAIIQPEMMTVYSFQFAPVVTVACPPVTVTGQVRATT